MSPLLARLMQLTLLALLGCAKHSPSASEMPETLATGPAIAELARAMAAGPPEAGARPEDVLVPLGRWVRCGPMVGYTYVDPEQGLSMQGAMPSDAIGPAQTSGGAPATGSLVVRLVWRPAAMAELSAAEREALGLPEVPDWLHFYGPQQPAGTLFGSWRLDPRLAARLYGADYPDDIQVVFDDGPGSAPELMWVRILSCADDLCQATVLNAPFKLKSVRLGEVIAFKVRPEDQLLMRSP